MPRHYEQEAKSGWCRLILGSKPWVAVYLILAVVVGMNAIPASATFWKWSKTSSENATADSTISWAEGQAPGTINDSARAMMSALAKFREDLSGQLNTSGTSTAYTVTSNQAFTSLNDGAQIAFRLDKTNGAAPTLNLDNLGAKPLRLVSASDLVGAELVAGAIYTATYDSGGDEWLIANPVSTGLVPAGTVADFAGTSAPTGWLLMHGQCVSRTTYAALFAVIGTTYDNSCAGDEFGLHDARGRVVAGQDDMGGTSANRLTNQSGGLDGDTLGATGGAETHTLTEAELAPHDHPASTSSTPNQSNWADSASVTSVNDDAGEQQEVLRQLTLDGLSINSTTTVSSAGGGGAHNNVQPTLILNKIVKH